MVTLPSRATVGFYGMWHYRPAARVERPMSERTVVIHADVDGSSRVVGRLTAITANEREEAHFELDPLWQKTSHHRLLQPMLRHLRGPHLGGGTMPLFGAVGDSAPDRWGRTLMRRAERKRAWREKRAPRVLSEMDFLLGVRDEIRAGSLRFAEREGGPYAGGSGAPIPSVDSLARLLDAVRAHERDEETPAQTRLLLETGQLLGGSRPKASVRDRDGHLLIAKFPSRGDPRDMQRWETLALTLAHACGICVPAFGIVRVKGCSVMLSRRFDREEGSGRRMPFVSMLGLLGADDNKSQSYARMADVVREIGSRPRDDLQELWRRALFAVLISDKDCHLRNHGMLLDATGWRLAPAFDLVPTAQALRPREMAISLDGVDDRATLQPLFAMAERFGLAERDARAEAARIARITRGWRDCAKELRIAREEIHAMRGAFEHDELEEALRG